jgi:hypothetical protein
MISSQMETGESSQQDFSAILNAPVISLDDSMKTAEEVSAEKRVKKHRFQLHQQLHRPVAHCPSSFSFPLAYSCTDSLALAFSTINTAAALKKCQAACNTV